MPDSLPPALAALLKQPPVFEHFRTHTIVDTLRAVAATLTNVSALTLDNRQVSIPAVVSDWADQIEKGGTP